MFALHDGEESALPYSSLRHLTTKASTQFPPAPGARGPMATHTKKGFGFWILDWILGNWAGGLVREPGQAEAVRVPPAIGESDDGTRQVEAGRMEIERLLRMRTEAMAGSPVRVATMDLESPGDEIRQPEIGTGDGASRERKVQSGSAGRVESVPETRRAAPF